MNFELEISNYLSSDYNAFRSKLYAFSLAKPSEYFKIRESVVSAAKTELVKSLYKTISDLLNDGKVGNNQVVKIDGVAVKPSYPRQLTNNIALSHAATLDDMLEEIIEILMPLSIEKIMTSRLAAIGKGEGKADLA